MQAEAEAQKLTWAGYALEARVLLKLAVPILIAQLAITGLGVIDTVMSGHVGTDDLAAIGLGSSLMFPVLMVPMGILLALTPLVSKRFGQDDPTAIRRYLQQGLWLSVPLGLLAMVVLMQPQWVLDQLSLSPSVYQLTQDYLIYVALGLPGLALYLALRFFWEGLSLTWPTMAISVLALLVNVPLNAVFIYGWGPVPAFGAAGCGIASTLVMWGMLGVGIWFVRRHPKTRPLTAWQASDWFRYRWRQGMADILSLGVPNMLALLFEVTLFSLIAVFIAKLGTEVIAANQVVMSYTSMAFMIPLSLSLAVTVRVGTAFGQGSLTAMRLSVRTGLAVAVLFSSVVALVTFSAREQIAAFYTQDPAVIAIALWLLLLAAAYQVFDAIQVTSAGILRGLHHTKTTMLVTFVSYWGLGMGGGYIMAFTDWWLPPQGVGGFWLGIVFGLILAAGLLQWKLWHLKAGLVKKGVLV
ncbi:MATE family efflux transporter [Thiomicrospira sp. WB1]|uniref:MATE family efflux transporter n=1 Tax=Thiomicrospira sp. WB1 TaxID=1685380 RepID=UPI00074A4630|nr:MATE family efflux transporter [Thiomicrospira sp. WB1]KUJ72141.1 MATE family efflux transporter [Thiomicrospira sp. WB1]